MLRAARHPVYWDGQCSKKNAAALCRALDRALDRALGRALGWAGSRGEQLDPP
jgi:hypothetical protein